MTDRGFAGGDSPRWNHRLSVSDCFVHDPGEEAGGRQPVATGLNPPDPETVALIDLDGAAFASFGSFPDPVVRSEGFDIVAPSGFHIVAFEIDEAFAHLLAANDFVGAFGGVRHCRSVEDWRGGEKRKR